MCQFDKPCPWCMSRDLRVERTDITCWITKVTFRVVCDVCDCKGPKVEAVSRDACDINSPEPSYEDAIKEAIRRWNDRS